MRRLSHTIDIAVPPERVWSWLEQMADSYCEWHPDHVSASWEGPPNQVGSVMRVVEVLGGRREELRMRLTSLQRPRHYRYRFVGPIGLMLPYGEFTVAPHSAGAKFTATIACRWAGLIERLMPRRVEALRTHMAEEGENLKRLLEKAVRDSVSSP